MRRLGFHRNFFYIVAMVAALEPGRVNRIAGQVERWQSHAAIRRPDDFSCESHPIVWRAVFSA